MLFVRAVQMVCLFLFVITFSLLVAVEIDLGVGADITQSDETSLSCARLSLLASVGPLSIDLPIAQIWPSERRLELADPMLSYAGLNLKLPITVLYMKAGLGVQLKGLIDLVGGSIEGWDVPARVRAGLGLSDSGLFLEGGVNLDFTPSLESMSFFPYIAAGFVF